MLPAPQQKGIIVATQPNGSKSATNLSTTIAWQVGNHVYGLQETGNPLPASTTVLGGTNTRSTVEVSTRVQVSAVPNTAAEGQNVTIHVRLLTATGQGAANQMFGSAPKISNNKC